MKRIIPFFVFLLGLGLLIFAEENEYEQKVFADILQKYSNSAPAAAVPVKNAAPTETSTATKATANAWRVTKSKKDDYTEFIFTSAGIDNHCCVVIYQRNDRKYSSRVIVGLFVCNNGFDDCEIKCDNGTVIKIHSKGNYSYLENGKKTRLDTEYKIGTGSGRNWLKIFINNKHIVTKAKETITHFETAGLLDKMAEYCITWEEIDNALANEEF